MPARKMKGAKQTFSARVKKSRLNRPDLLHVLTNYKHFFDAMAQFSSSPSPHNRTPTHLQHSHNLNSRLRTKIAKARRVWDLYYPLVSLSMQAQVNITEKKWLKKARAFGQAFCEAYGRKKVTTYMHIFVYHYGFFLARYKGIEKFANYALEGKHRVTKRYLSQATSGFGGKGGEPKAAQQQLQALVRGEVHANRRRAAGKCDRKDSTCKTWAEKSLSAADMVKKYVDSSTHI